MNTVDHATEVQSVRDIIRAFLDLPVEAMPSAQFVDRDEPGNAWDAIREYMIDGDTGCGVEVRLHADRQDWQDVFVTLV